MIMEAMRLSLIEHEEQQRKEAEERRRQEAACAAEVASNLNNGSMSQLPAAQPSSTLTPPPSSSQASLAPSPSAANQNNQSNTAQQQRISPSHSQSRFYNFEPGNPLSIQNRQTVSNRPFPIATTILGLPVTSQSQSRLATSSSTSISPTTTASPHPTPPPNANDKTDQGEDRPPAVPPKLPLNTASSIDASASTNASNSRDSIDPSSYKPLPSSPESGNEIMNNPLLAVIQKNSRETRRSLSGGSVPRQDEQGESTADG